MTRRSDETLSRRNEVLPYVVMLTTTCMDMIGLKIVKAAMNDGLTSSVYVVYHNALGTLILLPFFLLHIRRFMLHMLCLWELMMCFRMETIDITSPNTIAKLMGTVVAISGAMVFTFYQGPDIFVTLDSSNPLLSSQPSKWELGGVIIFLSNIFGCIWNVLHSATTKEFPDQFTVAFFFCFFGTIQCIALSPFLEPNPSEWLVQPGIKMIATDKFGLKAGYTILYRVNAITWCLEKKGPVFVAMFSPLSIVIGVILGVTFLGDSLHLGRILCCDVGQAKENNKLKDEMDNSLDFVNEPGSSDQHAPLLQSLS
ncbi:WAT1-related protein At5g40240-like [Bidens hawaiensis]|uniref:WAT1-related protein At5g40240-like n=1 Tax=Bidens hawaiensis TaxID=980011 RepID=UPI00404A5B91